MITLSIILIISSCGGGDDTKEKKSLLDTGFIDKESTVLDEDVDDSGLFDSKSSKHYGIDISHWQGNVLENLDSRDSLRFIICKATEGNSFVDPDFRSNWNGIKEKGLIRGTYHFYQCQYDPVSQAEHFVTAISDITRSDIAPILDIEEGSMTPDVSGEQMEKDILAFLQTVQHKLNRKPILYTNYEFAQQYLKNPELAYYDLWLAEYTSTATPLVPDLWEKKGYKIWQKSATYDAYSKPDLDLDEYVGILSEIVD